VQLLVLVLNQVDKLDDLLKVFMNNGITGATIINSTGMIKELASHMEYQPIFGSLFININSYELIGPVLTKVSLNKAGEISE